MKSILREIFKALCRIHPYENGKYQILMKLYYPFLAPKESLFIETSLKFGIKMNLNIKEYVQAFLYNYGAYELPTINFFRKQIKQGMCVIDVGANVGYHSLIMTKLVGQKGSVYSFEPEIKNIELLNTNIKLNRFKNINIIKKAVSNQNGSIKLYLSNSDNLGVHSTVFCEDTVSNKFEEIEAVKLDDFVTDNQIKKVDFVKIDVEGAETDVLAGMENILLNHRPIIVMELVEKLQNIKGWTTKSVKEMMKNKYNYKAYKILENGDHEELDINSIQASDNLAFIPM